MSDLTKSQTLDAWEETFADGLVANSREQPEPWMGSYVHVIEDAPPEPGAVRTDLERGHSILLFTDGISRAQEQQLASSAHYDTRLDPGDTLVYSREMSAHPHLTAWHDPASFVHLHLGPDVVRDACRSAGLDYDHTEFIDRFPAQDPLLESLIRQLGAELEAGAPGGRLYAEQLMQTAAMHLVRHHTSGDRRAKRYTGGVPPARLRRVEEYVEAHLSDEIQLEDLAEEAEMSQYHFCRQFKKSTGQSPYQYVIERRVEEGKRLLEETDQLVVQVAFAVGYDSQSRFTKQFKKRVGTTPGAYRNALS